MTRILQNTNNGEFIKIELECYHAGQRHFFHVTINAAELVQRYGAKAMKNANGKVREAHGAVVIEDMGT